MIGLMQKDLYLLWQTYRKNLIYVAVLYMLLSTALKMPIFVQMLGWILGFYVVSTITMDNTSKWDLYATSLPVSRHQIVSSKYLLTVFLLVAGQVFSLVCTGILRLFGRLDLDYSLAEVLLSCFAVFCAALAAFGISLCLTYRFGAEKTRTIIMIMGVVLLAFIFFISAVGSASMSALLSNPLLDLMKQYPAIVFGGGAVVCALIYFFTWFLALRWYDAKEF